MITENITWTESLYLSQKPEIKKGRVSFIIVNWNGIKTIAECLDSILAQSYKNYEIIFVDNYSTDGSAQLVQRRYKPDKFISLNRNYGYAQANNIGLRHAKGEYLALVNNDAVLDKHWLRKAVDVLAKDESQKTGSVATKIINYHQPTLIDTAGVEFFGFGAGWDYKGLSADSKEVNQRKEVFGACATAALYRKQIIDQIGLFDPRYFIYFEDTDLAFKLRLFGYKCIYEPEAVCYHYGGVKRDKNSKFYIQFGRRNIEFLFFKNMQGHLLAKYLWSHCLYESALFLFFLLAGKGIPFIKAKIEFIVNLGYVLQERKKLKLALIRADKFKDASKIEHFFLPSRLRWRGWLDKLRKAVQTYKTYMNLD